MTVAVVPEPVAVSPDTVGAVVSGTVVNDHVTGAAIMFPVTSAARNEAVYVVPFANAAAGVNVSVRLAASYVVAPATAPGAVSDTVVVAGFKGSLNVALTGAEVAMPVPPAGDRE